MQINVLLAGSGHSKFLKTFISALPGRIFQLPPLISLESAHIGRFRFL